MNQSIAGVKFAEYIKLIFKRRNIPDFLHFWCKGKFSVVRPVLVF